MKSLFSRVSAKNRSSSRLLLPVFDNMRTSGNLRSISNLVKGAGKAVDKLRDSTHTNATIDTDALMMFLKDTHILNTYTKPESTGSARVAEFQSMFTSTDVLLAIAQELSKEETSLKVDKPGGIATSWSGGTVGHEVIARYPPLKLTSEQIKLIETLGPNNLIRVFFRAIMHSFGEVPPAYWDRVNEEVDNELLRSYISLRGWGEYLKIFPASLSLLHEHNLTNIQQNKPLSSWLLGVNPVSPIGPIHIQQGDYIILGNTMATGPRHIFTGNAGHIFILNTKTGQLHQIQVGFGTNRFAFLDGGNNAMFLHMWGVGRAKLYAIIQNPNELLYGVQGMMNIPPWSMSFNRHGSSRDLHARIRDYTAGPERDAEYILRALNGTSGIAAGLRNLSRRFGYGNIYEGPLLTPKRRAEIMAQNNLNKAQAAMDPKSEKEVGKVAEQFTNQLARSSGELASYHQILDAKDLGTSEGLSPNQEAMLRRVIQREEETEAFAAKEYDKAMAEAERQPQEPSSQAERRPVLGVSQASTERNAAVTGRNEAQPAQVLTEGDRGERGTGNSSTHPTQGRGRTRDGEEHNTDDQKAKNGKVKRPIKPHHKH